MRWLLLLPVLSLCTACTPVIVERGGPRPAYPAEPPVVYQPAPAPDYPPREEARAGPGATGTNIRNAGLMSSSSAPIAICWNVRPIRRGANTTGS